MTSKLKRVLALLIVFIFVGSCLMGCAAKDKAEINKLINNFETACHNMDLDAMMDCINPSLTNTVRSVTSFLGIDDLNSTLDDILSLIGFVNIRGDSPKEMLSTLQIKIKNIDLTKSGNHASVSAKLYFEIGTEEKEEDFSFSCKKIDGKWYIAGVK